uniref:Uncharacterized protein n=1 Tax=Coccidioides posadasii RMSCC 3488 TaxID=454284 RepID=A0A0J6EXF5_COCPO|nr:hypothetical protein CPAG_01577 [Coccidioides posadasii RMSCC 3488]
MNVGRIRADPGRLLDSQIQLRFRVNKPQSPSILGQCRDDEFWDNADATPQVDHISEYYSFSNAEEHLAAILENVESTQDPHPTLPSTTEYGVLLCRNEGRKPNYPWILTLYPQQDLKSANLQTAPLQAVELSFDSMWPVPPDIQICFPQNYAWYLPVFLLRGSILSISMPQFIRYMGRLRWNFLLEQCSRDFSMLREEIRQANAGCVE